MIGLTCVNIITKHNGNCVEIRRITSEQFTTLLKGIIMFPMENLPEEYKVIPEHTMNSLLAYQNDRREPGDFLKAVLSNDLQGAMARADEENLATLKKICQFVYNRMANGCHGSREIVKQWLNGS